MLVLFLIPTQVINISGFSYSKILQYVNSEGKKYILSKICTKTDPEDIETPFREYTRTFAKHYAVSSLFIFVDSSIHFHRDFWINIVSATYKKKWIKNFHNETFYHLNVYFTDIYMIVKEITITTNLPFQFNIKLYQQPSRV